MMRICLVLGLLACACLLPGAPGADPWRGPYPDDPDLPEGFSDTLVATGITGATGLAAAPDGRLFVCEQTGALRVIKDDALLSTPFVTLEVDSYWERGLIGVALDPAFPRRPYVYLCYVAARPYPHHRVSRFTARGDVAEPGSEVVLLEGDDQRRLGGAQPAGHQGGGLQFGADGKLYVAIGEQTAGAPAQRLDTFQGKLLRINPDGSIPEDNPFYSTAAGKYRAIWALGLRNPFAFAVQPGTGRIYINDVGNSRLEEINEGVAGANYGWPESEGPTTNPKHRGPVFAYDRNVGRSITGGTFYNPPVRQFPERFVGKYFFLDFMDHWIRVLDPADPSTAAVFATGLAGPVAIVTAPDGTLYYLNRKEWVKDEKFHRETGSVHRIRYGADADGRFPRIRTQPADVIAAAGQAAAFRLTAAGEEPLRYRWLRNGRAIPGAAAELVLPAVGPANDGAEFRCVVTNACGSTRSRRARLRVLPWQEPARPPALLPGLRFRYYEGVWKALPDLTSLTPAKSSIVAGIDLSGRNRDQDFGCVWQGFLEADTDGVYSFTLAASGLAKLFVGGVEIASTAGTKAVREASGRVALRAGKHPLLLVFLHAAGRPRLELHTTPAPSFFHADSPAVPGSSPAPVAGAAPYGLSRREVVATLNVPPDPADLPRLLSETGVFRSLADLIPNPGIIPYTVNAPLWSDGADKRRWMALPGTAAIGFAPRGEWKFPAGTVFIKQFEATPGGRRLETRLLVVGLDGGGYGVTYRWRPDQSDAELLPDGLTEDVPHAAASDAPPLKWTYPGRKDCLVCHTAIAGFVLGVKTRQLNGPFTYPATGVTDNQLRTWNHLRLFAPALDEAAITRFDRLAAATDATASPEHRVRSYLDANCAQCHRPGGARGLFDARFDMPLARQNLINGPVAAADLGVGDARLIAPGAPGRSLIYERMNRRRDVYDMPPLATHQVDRDALLVLAEWIRRLPVAAPK
jgi:uncharacterized repeat protein (TIGR03806 family)